MAKRNNVPAVCVYDPSPNEEARFFESMEHGGWHQPGNTQATRDGLDGNRPMPSYSHHHNPEQRHSRSQAAPLSGRSTGTDVSGEGLSHREPMRADLDDAMR